MSSKKMMKSLEKRIRRLEPQKPKKGPISATWEEFTSLYSFLCNFSKLWPDEDAAPKFLQWEYHRVSKSFQRFHPTDKSPND